MVRLHGPQCKPVLSTRDHYTSSTRIGGKGGAGPSLLHTSLEGPTEYVNIIWMSSLHGFLHGTKWIMCHGHLDYFQKPTLGGRPNSWLMIPPSALRLGKSCVDNFVWIFKLLVAPLVYKLIRQRLLPNGMATTISMHG